MITKKEIKEKLEKDIGKEIKVLELKNNKAKVKEIICHHTWEDKIENIINTEDYQCPICHKAGQHGRETYKLDKWKKTNAKQGKNTQQFKEEIKQKYGNEYIVLGKYKNNSTKILIKHNKCGNEFMRRPNSLLQGSGCPKCAMKQRIKTRKEKGIGGKTTKQFKKEIEEVKLNDVEVIGEYKKGNIPIKMRCNDCGNVFYRKPTLMLHNWAECPNCRKERLTEKRRRKNEKKFLKKVENMYGFEYTVLGKYINADTKIKVKHNKCGRTWQVTPQHFTTIDKRRDKETGTTCPYCFKESNKFLYSKGMENTEDYLIENNIPYTKEFWFKGLQDNGHLKFDFAIFDGKELDCLIEYDGRQHYEPVKRFGGEEQYKKQQKKDKMKNNYCEKHNIDLIRIPYWKKDNIPKILDEKLI